MGSRYPQNSVLSVHRAIDVLEFISSTQREDSLSEITDNLDIPRQSMVFNFLLDDGDRCGQMVRQAADKALRELGYKIG